MYIDATTINGNGTRVHLTFRIQCFCSIFRWSRLAFLETNEQDEIYSCLYGDDIMAVLCPYRTPMWRNNNATLNPNYFFFPFLNEKSNYYFFLINVFSLRTLVFFFRCDFITVRFIFDLSTSFVGHKPYYFQVGIQKTSTKLLYPSFVMKIRTQILFPTPNMSFC